MKENKLLRLGLQFFAEGGDGGTDDSGAAGAAADKGAEGAAAGNGAEGAAGQDDGKGNGSDGDQAVDKDALERIIQSRVDRALAKMGKDNADLKKQLDAVRKQKLSDDELRQIAIDEKEKALAEKERTIKDSENRLYAIKALGAAGLYDGGDKSIELVELVLGEDEKDIDAKVKAFDAIVKKFVAAEVEKTFKQNGRNPNGGSGGSGSGDKDDSIATKLGKNRAEQTKKSNDTLKFYLGGK